MNQNTDDNRESSRKWILVNFGIRLYTLVHLLNAAGVLLAVSRDWIQEAGAVELWSHSVTTWSAGVIFFAGLYKLANVAQKWSPPDPGRTVTNGNNPPIP